MPSRLKDETQDVKGNQYVVTAADVNKHDEEIRAIEKVLGLRRPRFPGSGFSGICNDEGEFEPICLPEQKVSGCCPGATPPPCIDNPPDVLETLQSIADALAGIRDDSILMASGIVAIKDPSNPGANGTIVWPSDWPVTTLSSAIRDDSVDEEEPLPDLDEVQLADVSGLPEEGGFITIINDASTILFRSRRRNIRLIGFTSIATSSDPIYDQADIDLEFNTAKKQKIFGLGTNVEILEYEELDAANNKLLGVTRKQLGTSATRHAAGDLVFKGRVSITVSPINYRLDRQRIDQVDCVLRSDGSIDLRVRNRDRNKVDPDDDDDTTLAYAHYHAILLKELDPIPSFDPGKTGGCQDDSVFVPCDGC